MIRPEDQPTEHAFNLEGETRPHWSFGDLQERMRFIYEAHNEACGYGPDTILVKLLGNSLHLKKAVRTAEFDTSRIDSVLLSIFTWTAVLANYGNIDLYSTVGEKFFAGCPRCHQPRCICTNAAVSGESTNFRKLPYTLSEWQEHFTQMYPNNFDGETSQNLAFIADRLYEEAGELVSSTDPRIAKEIDDISHHDMIDDDVRPWRGEIADVLAWSFAMAQRLSLGIGGYSLEQSLRDHYGEGCPYCKNPICICPKETTIFELLHKGEA